MEVTEELLAGGLKIIQDTEYYRFTSDSVLLSRFLRAKKGNEKKGFSKPEKFLISHSEFSLVSVLQAGVLIDAAKEHFPAVELQEFAVLLLMEGDDAFLIVDPDAPQGLFRRLLYLFHRKRLLSNSLYKIRRFRKGICFSFSKIFSKNFQQNKHCTPSATKTQNRVKKDSI